MSDRVNLLRRVDSLDVAPQFTNYSKVRILLGQNDSGEDVVYEAGGDYGRTLELENPFGTQAMANRILQKIRGYQYQPFKATGALLDPSAEIGDGISVDRIYGGMYNRSRDFSRLMKADIEAPHDEEIDHEYKFETSQERKYQRQFKDVRATLSIESDRITAEVAQREADSAEFRGQLQVQATQIAAKVSQTGGNNASFGWSLKATEFGLYAGNTKVFWVNSTGAHVKGEITATSGKIGNFNIGSTAIYNNISRYGGTQTTGVYLGTDGIQLGQRFKVDTYGNITASNLNINGGSISIGNNFYVDSSGNVTANNMTLNGSLNIGGGYIWASDLRVGAQESYNGYNGWNGTRDTVNDNGENWTSAYDWKYHNGEYCVGGAGYGYNFDAMKYGGGNAFPINASSFRYGGTQLTPQTISILDGNKNVRTFYGVLMEASE